MSPHFGYQPACLILLTTITVLMSGVAHARAQSALDGDVLDPEPVVGERFRTNFAHTHDRGLAFDLGAGLVWSDSDVTPPRQGTTDERERGIRPAVTLSLGGLVRERLSVSMAGWATLGAERGFLGCGPRFVFYPRAQENWRISGALGASTFFDSAPDIRVLEQWGMSGQLELGTGWWVSRHSTLGVSVVGSAHAFDLDGDQVAGQAWAAGVQLTFGVN